VAGTGYDVEAFARDTAEFAAATGKPLVVTASQPNVAAHFEAAELPVFVGETQAIEALNQFLRHSELMDRTARRHADTAPVRPGGAAPGRMLNEADSLALVASRGIRTVPHRLCRTADEAEAAFAALGGPVVVKGCSADVAHKSELDLVRLGLADAAAVRSAFTDCARILQAAGKSFDGVIVAAMARARREMLIGAHRDPVFGPVVVIGDGGKYVEVMPDVRLLLPPFGPDEVRDALEKLRIAPLLAGVRGEPPLDVDAFCAAAVAVGRLMESDSRVHSLDMNPVMLGAAGEGYVVVDAVVIEG
jgi:acyl-CoA synthetase (NDP forming)